MALNFAKLKTLILAYVKRTEASVVKDDVNTVEIAVNNAMLAIQRDHDFNWLHKQIYVDCDPIGNVLTGAKLSLDDTSVKVKRLLKAYLKEPNSDQLQPIDFQSQATHAHDVHKAQKLGLSRSQSGEPARLVQQGQNIWLYPRPTAATRVYFDAVVYLAELDGDSDTNFLLEYARDYLMYSSIIELNFFIKEDERYQISQTQLSRARKSLLNWDNTLVTFTDGELDL